MGAGEGPGIRGLDSTLGDYIAKLRTLSNVHITLAKVKGSKQNSFYLKMFGEKQTRKIKTQQIMLDCIKGGHFSQEETG